MSWVDGGNGVKKKWKKVVKLKVQDVETLRTKRLCKKKTSPGGLPGRKKAGKRGGASQKER